jgi:hypothetical protein
VHPRYGARKPFALLGYASESREEKTKHTNLMKDFMLTASTNGFKRRAGGDAVGFEVGTLFAINIWMRSL